MSAPQEPSSSESNDIPKPAVLGSGYRHFGFLALMGAVFGTIIASVLSTSSTDATVVMVYAVPIIAIVGIVGGVRYGFFFNTVNRCTGGRLLFGTVAGLIAAAAGAMLVSLLMVIVGTVTGLAAGWIVGWLLPVKGREGIPWLGAGVGAVAQAGWTNPAVALRAAIWGGVVGACVGPVLFLICLGLSYVLLRKRGLRRSP